jgi:hypothetical protein
MIFIKKVLDRMYYSCNGFNRLETANVQKKPISVHYETGFNILLLPKWHLKLQTFRKVGWVICPNRGNVELLYVYYPFFSFSESPVTPLSAPTSTLLNNNTSSLFSLFNLLLFLSKIPVEFLLWSGPKKTKLRISIRVKYIVR